MAATGSGAGAPPRSSGTTGSTAEQQENMISISWFAAAAPYGDHRLHRESSVPLRRTAEGRMGITEAWKADILTTTRRCCSSGSPS